MSPFLQRFTGRVYYTTTDIVMSCLAAALLWTYIGMIMWAAMGAPGMTPEMRQALQYFR